MLTTSRIVLGYHGCDQKVARQVISQTAHIDLKQSNNDYDWLGHGVYFWENDPQRAMSWARMKKGVKNPAVVGAVIDLGTCLDLMVVENLEFIKNAYESLRQLSTVAEVALPQNKQGYAGDEDLLKRDLDCAVINHLHKLRKEEKRPPFDTVRSPFSEGEPLYDGAKIMERTHIQICVRNSKNILGYFKPRFF